MKTAAVALALALAACSHGDPPTASSPVTTAPPAPPAPAARGKVSTEHFHSDALGVDKDYVVYVPAGYDSGKHYPVFYYLNGLGGNETNWVKHGHLDAAADQLGLEAIVVMPDGDDAFYADGVAPVDYDACIKDGTGLFMQKQRTKTCVRKRSYETYIVKDLVAEVDAKYHTIARREGRAIAGLSMGGFGAFELSMRHQDVFSAGKVALLTDLKLWGAGAPIPDLNPWMRAIFGEDIANWRQHDPSYLVQQLAPGALALYLDCGTDDDFWLNDDASYLHDLLTARKIDHAFFLGPGHHDFTFWTARLPESLKFLRDHVAKPAA
jgi:S-formylglutathione hydrolase FrmB